jgi:Ca2+:H+ antiporter
MKRLFKEIRHNPLLWLLAFVPVVFAAARLKPDAHTLLFVLSVLAIVPLAALLSHAPFRALRPPHGVFQRKK